MCSVPGCRNSPGGGRFAASFTTLCNLHRQRDRRHGDALQWPVRITHLTPFIKSLQRRQKLRPEAPAWSALEARWLALVSTCKGTLTLHNAGQPGNRSVVEAAQEIVRVADQATPEQAWQTVVAMFLLRAADPHRFPTERSFRVQLGRRVRHLADMNRGTYWAPDQGRFLQVYRDPAARAALIVGDMLLETFGVAGAYFHKQGQAEAAAMAAERANFYAALAEVAPEGAMGPLA